MPEYIFCPSCQRKNPADLKMCIYCGLPLHRSPSGPTTIEQILTIFPDVEKWRTFCNNYLVQLEPSVLALFIAGHLKPLLFQHIPAIYLGRAMSDKPVEQVNLAEYDGFKLGVSRYHARITPKGNIYQIGDLYSSNGTWLNNQRLMSGTLYDLHNGDILHLARLQIVVCFHENS